MDSRVTTRSQNRRTKLSVTSFPSAKERRGLPRFFVKEVVATEKKGIITTIRAKSTTNRVMGMRHRPRSTMLGRVDLPETVMYCFLPTTKLLTYSTTLAMTIRNTARVVASVRPSWLPMLTKSMMRVVTVCT